MVIFYIKIMFKMDRERSTRFFLKKFSVYGIKNHWSAAVRGGARRVRPLDPLVLFTFFTFGFGLFLKELEHRKLGWKVLILKYDLGKSLSKEMWCKIDDTKKIWLHILKDEKCR